MGQLNRETKREDRTTKYIRDLMDKVAALESAHEQPDFSRLPFAAVLSEGASQRSFAGSYRRKTRTAA